MRLISENKKGKPDKNGASYVNPPSCYRIEMEVVMASRNDYMVVADILWDRQGMNLIEFLISLGVII